MSKPISTMRNILISVAVISVVATTAIILTIDQKTTSPDDASSISEARMPSSSLREEIDQLSRKLARLQESYQEQIDKARLNQTGVADKISDMNARLMHLESVALEKEKDEHIAKQGEEVEALAMEEQNIDTIPPNDTLSDSEGTQVSQAEIAEWMDQTLDTENWNEEATNQAWVSVNESLTRLPGVNLDDMQCSNDFCRAIFFQESGGRPNIRSLVGMPPFATEGFTIHETDGAVSLYFTQPGMSLEDFRRQVQNSAQ